MPPQQKPEKGAPMDRSGQSVEDFFVYSINFDALNAGTTADGNIQIQADSNFKWLKSAFYATIADASFTWQGQPIPNVTVQITDSGSGRQLVDRPVPVPSIFGLGVLPFILPVPRIFQARSNISIQVSNFDAAENYNLRLMFIGTKIFTFG